MRRISARRRTASVLCGLAALGLALAGLVAWLNVRGEEPLPPSPVAVAADAATVARGAYLARAGNCMGCHTARGGAEYAGGRGIETPFGTVYASNLTPDAGTGLGRWSAAEFWRALHHGRSKDGRLLYPAFPYPEFTLVTRADSDALYAYLRSLPPVRQEARAHELRFPYGLQASLAVWRALYFRPARFEPQPQRSADWNRGSYLVRGLGHCVACHSGRNVLGATAGGPELGGGLIPMQDWYAPPLAAPSDGGGDAWAAEVVTLLKDGRGRHGSAMGPMAEVVYRSTRHLTEDDLRGMAAYLGTLPPAAAPEPAEPADPEVLRQGRKLYGAQCASCHGERGEGQPGRYPALAGNRAVTLASPNNLIKVVLHGGFAPATVAHPRPYGMPPFAQSLGDAEIAAVATHVRQSWGNAAPAVSPADVIRAR
jgi:mono/diheme cytochrome c family protein